MRGVTREPSKRVERERTSCQLVSIKLQRKVIGRCWSACLFSSLWCCLCGPVQQRAEWTQTDEAQTSQHWTEQGQTEQNSRSPEPACNHFWFILSTDQIYRQITSNQNQCTLHDSLYRALQGSALVSRSTGFFWLDFFIFVSKYLQILSINLSLTRRLLTSG